jgi:PAS domain S-box-containing protein
MIDPAKSTAEFYDSIPVGAAPLESILCTEQLLERPWRPPDHDIENSALVALVSALADSPRTILQTLADKVLAVLDADSAGLSLLTKDEKRFYWAAIAGAWRPHIGGGTPRNFGPCGDVLDSKIAMLFTHWERRYPYLSTAIPLADEGLLVPFFVNGKAVGTIWAIAHNSRRKFDAEDLRLLQSMGRFASAAYQTVESIEDLKLEIAAREKAEAAVRQMASGLQAKIRRLVDSNIIGIFIWASDGRIIDANDTFLRVLGYERDDLDRLNWKTLTPTEWRAADDQLVLELEVGGSAQPYEKEFLQKCGDRVPVLVGAAKFEEPGDQGVAFVLDLTERKRSAREVRESERRYNEMQIELAHANRFAAVGELSGSIAHEIKQPLTAILANASAARRWLSRERPDTDQVRKSLDQIQRAADHASSLIQNLRTVFKRDTGDKSLVDINKTILTILALGKGEIEKHKIKVEMELDHQLPSVIGNEVQVQQVVMNLVMNATEAMHSVQPRILRIQSRLSKSNTANVSIEDTGTGIDPSAKHLIFQPLFTTKANGMGMGLSICHSIIENHNGRIWASEGVGRGSIFHFELPIVDGQGLNTPH